MMVRNSEHNNSWEKQEKKNNISTHIPTYLLAALLLVPVTQTKSEDGAIIQQQNLTEVYEHQPSIENPESMMSYESIFKDGIKEALKWLNHIHQIPVWGKHINYYRDQGNSKNKQLKEESINTLNLPDRFDISPRHITTPVPSMIFSLGNRKFSISPLIGKINAIVMTPDWLVIETTLLDMIYNKQDKLPNLMFRLRMTPVGKWEKPWFRWTTVVEL